MLQKPLKALLCIHGAGGSAPIFRVQTSKLRAALKNEFDFVYATAPLESEPGPGVLPLFQGMGPYYSWFRDDDRSKHSDTQVEPADDDQVINAEMKRKAIAVSVANKVDVINAPVQKAIEDWREVNPQTPIVGVIAFSEGALVATLLLWQHQMGRLPWFPKVTVALFVCCYYRDEATDYMLAESQNDRKQLQINVSTLHVQGRQDFALQGSKKMVETHYPPQSAHVFEFQGRHHFPTRRSDTEEVAKRFLQLYQNSNLKECIV